MALDRLRSWNGSRLLRPVLVFAARRSVDGQARGFLGVWLGGIAFDRTGSYDLVWWLAILFGVLSALINLPIVEKPVARMAPLPA